MVYVQQAGRVPRGRMDEKPLLLATLATLSLSVLFIAYPQIDIAVTHLFYVEGVGFPARHVDGLATLRAIGQYFPLTLTIVLLIALILKLSYPSRPSLFPPRFTLYFTSLFLLGPAILVNLILKPFIDRPRPGNVDLFGGPEPFQAAWEIGGDIFAHRSFVSGEAAVVVCLIPLALFVPVVWRRCVFVLLTAFAIAISVNRIAFGAHFLSDVTIAAGLMSMLAIGLWYLIFVRPGNKSCDIRLEAQLTELGHFLHAWRRRNIAAARTAIGSQWQRLQLTAPSQAETAKGE